MKKKFQSAHALFPLILLVVLGLPYFIPALAGMRGGMAVISGIVLSLWLGNPYHDLVKKITPKLLAWSIIGLGFGMNLMVVIKVGLQGIGYTIISIILAIALGMWLGRLLKNSNEGSLLITIGTAICGGSAIAAVSAAIHAKPENVSLALAVVFVLNAVALLIFPCIGHALHLSQTQFGLWSALAIQDTSSVVGATLQYGQESLLIGTTVKLARALWIVPLTFIIGFIYARKAQQKTKLKKPWFILGFLLAAAIVTWIPFLQPIGAKIHTVAEYALIVALFCIGSSLSRETLHQVGFKPLLQGTVLWVCLALATLLAISLSLIKL